MFVINKSKCYKDIEYYVVVMCKKEWRLLNVLFYWFVFVFGFNNVC